MLPDFIEVKRKLSKQVQKYLREKIKNSESFLREIRQKIQHEGGRLHMKTYDGYVDEIEYKALESEFTIKSDEIIKEGIGAFKKHIDEVAKDISSQQAKIVFQKLNEITSKTGNVVDAKGEPFTKEKLLEVIEKIDVDFDEHGQPVNLMIVMGPVLFNKVKDQIPAWEKDEDFMKKHNEILERKRREWLDRENNRKLVD